MAVTPSSYQPLANELITLAPETARVRLTLAATAVLLIGSLVVMVVLGPLLVAQYAWWQRPERTTCQFLLAEGVRRRTVPAA